MASEQTMKSRERFVREVAEHQMTVLRDDGLYRHLRFQRDDGSSSYWFDLVTWPGCLVVNGDCGTFTFSRTRDMFEFFGPSGARGGFEDARWGINPDYWSEKLQAPKPDGAERFSEDAARARVLDWLADYVDGYPDPGDEFDEHGPCGGRRAFDLYRELREQILDRELYNESEARRLIGEFEHDGVYLDDAWEWSMREYDWQFLWCCWAIVWGISQYRSARGAREVSHAG
jgi:hypothetical protein